MTDSAIAAPVLPTALATFLAATANPPQLSDYRCVLTPRELDAPDREIAALTRGAGVHDLGWLRRVAVRGEDRFRWLNGMVTNAVNDMATNTGAWNLVLSAQGRILGDLTVWREGDGELEMEIDACQVERLMAHLEHYIIMDDVELVPLGHEPGAEETAIGVSGAQVANVLERVGLPVLAQPMTLTRVEWNGLDLRVLRGYGVLAQHYTIWTPLTGLTRLWRTLSTAGATHVGSSTLDALRIAEGIPTYGVDIVERDLPQETSQTRALHFAKGCYQGQEIVERIRSRGNVHRHLRSVELHGPIPASGTELSLNGKAVGNLTSAASLPLENGSRTFALAMVRSEAELPDTQFAYATETAAGKAQLLSTPPKI
jgi:folate-binding protein YgfZ